jgi:Tfp pilus assembly protein PilO
MINVRTALSPLAMRSLRALMPLAMCAVCSVGLAGGVWLVAQEPAQERLHRAEAAYEAARHTQSRQLEARRTQEELAATWRVLTVRKEFPSLVLAVADLAQRDGVAIPGMSYALQKAEGGLALKASMSFQISGDYAAIRRFIHRIETDERYLAVESLDAARSQKHAPAGEGRESVVEQVRFSVRVLTFLKPDGVSPRERT